MSSETPSRPSLASTNTRWRRRIANHGLVVSALSAYREAHHDDGPLRTEGATGDLRVKAEESRLAEARGERLLGIIGHDLRSPLSSITLAAQLLRSGGRLSKHDVWLLERITKSARRMAQMIAQLQRFTRASAGEGFAPKLASVDLGRLCANITEELSIGSSVEIRHTSSGNLVGEWDGDLLEEVISNLAGNAVDYAAPGTPVLIHAYDAGEAVVVEITNQGVCIAPDMLPLIFDAFRRTKGSTKGGKEHLGLGLYIAREIVNSHGGSLSVRSSDRTTTFTARLPRLSHR